MAITSPWPPQPALTYDEDGGGAADTTTTSTTGADLWGGGTTRPITARGLYLVSLFASVKGPGAGAFVSFRLQRSADGAAWVDVDPATFSWLDLQPGGTEYHPLTLQFRYAKAAPGTEYLRIQWKTTTGTASLSKYSTGWSQSVRVRCQRRHDLGRNHAGTSAFFSGCLAT